MAFEGPWCDGELRIEDEVFICDVECIGRFVSPPLSDPDLEVLAHNMYGVVTLSTSGAIEVSLRVSDLGDYGASTYLESLLTAALV